MAKYCIHCGKELKENEKCECFHESDFYGNVISLIKGIFVSPMDTIKENAKKDNFNFSMILMGVLSFILSIFSLGLIKVYYGSISLIDSYYRTFNNSMGISYFSIFVKILVLSFILSFVFAGVVYLVNTIIFKGKADFKKIYSLGGVISIVNSISLFAGFLILFINVYLAMAFVFLGFVLSLTYFYSSLKLLGIKDENKYGYMFLIIISLNLILISFFLNVII